MNQKIKEENLIFFQQNAQNFFGKMNQIPYPTKTLTPKMSTNFKKSSGNCNINTSGSQPIIMFKKSNKEPYDFEFKKKMGNTQQQQKNNYISDGGLKQKLERFNSCSNPSQSIKNVQKYLKSPKSNKIVYMEEKQKPKDSLPRTKKVNIEEQKLFSKTVRESNKRPVFPKNDKNKECYKTKTGFGVNKKNKQNNNSNNQKHNHHKKANGEDSKEQEERKILYMNQLVENAVVGEIRKYQVEKKLTPQELFVEKKKECLEENGTPIDQLDDNYLEEEDLKMNEDIKEEEPSSHNGNNGNYNNKITPNNNNATSKSSRALSMKYNNYINSYEDSQANPKIKKRNKPPVNQFEYLKKIKIEQKKLPIYSELHRRSMSHDFQQGSSSQLNDSFRHKNPVNGLESKDKPYKDNFIIKYKNSDDSRKYVPNSNDESVQKTSEDANDDFPYAHKKSHRTKKELIQFVKEKRIKDKQNEERKLLEKNKKLFLLFKNLHNLNLKDLNEGQFQKAKQQRTMSSNEKTNRTNRTNKTNSSNCIRKKKEINEYYIGNDATIKNNSTLIDPNEYYLNVLESQQLLVNSGLKRIDNDTETTEEKKETPLETNEINTKEQIQKITDKESKRFNDSSSKKSNNILNTNNYEELKQKIDNTMKRANEIFSKDNIKNYMNNITNTNSNSSVEKDDTELVEKKDTNNNMVNNNNKQASPSSGKKKQNEKKIGKNNQENIKIKSPEIDIETSNIDKKIANTGHNTKEGVLPSLSHTYSTNSNPNKKVEIEIEPRVVLNLVEILKFIIQRKVFIKIYENYINQAVFQRYGIAFAYFIAICKQYPFRMIEDYSNYKTYNNTFRQLLKPFIRKSFKYFLNNCYMKKKIEYLVILLTKIFKFKILERIYIYSQFEDGYKEKAFKLTIMKIIRTIAKPHLKKAFCELKDKILNQNQNNIDKNKDSFANYSIENNIKDKNSNIDKEEYKDVDYSNQIISQKEDKIEETQKKDPEEEEPKKENKGKEDKMLDESNKNESIENNLFNNSEDSELEGGHRKFDNSIKMNSFMYESLDNDSKSSLNIEPNSVDNDKLHQLKLMLMMRKNIIDGQEEEEEEEENERDNDGVILEQNSIETKESNQSAKSIHEIGNINSGNHLTKTLSDMLDENSIGKSNSKKNSDNLNKSNNSQSSNKSNRSKKSNNQKNDKKSKGKEIIKENIQKKEEKNKKEDKKEELIKDKKEDNKEQKIIENDQNIKEKKEEKEDSKNSLEIEEKIPEVIDEHIAEEVKRSQTELDISADNDKNNSIEWEYNVSTKSNNNNKIPLISGENEKENKNDSSQKFRNSMGEDVNIQEEFVIDQVDSPSEKNIKKDEAKKEENEKDKEKKIQNKVKESDNEYENDFEENISLSEKGEDNKKNNIINNNNDEIKLINNDIKQDKSRNSKPEDKEKDKNKEKDNKEDIDNKENKMIDKVDKKNITDNNENKRNDGIILGEEKEQDNLEKLKDVSDPEKLADEITEEMIDKILNSEIKSSKKKLVPYKKFKFDKFDKMNDGQSNSLANSFSSVGNIRDNLSKEFGLGNLSHLSLNDDLLSLNDSIMSSYSAHSYFNKTVKDKKKEHSLSLYFKVIAPKLIKIIRQEIYSKYPRIYANISSPMKNCSEKLMISLALQDADMLRDNYKSSNITEDIETILDKEQILKKFEIVNKQIRSRDNVTSDNFYDNMLNDCIIDTTIELINKERFYGKNGEPLKWSSRTHELIFKYKKNDPKKLANFVCKNLLKGLHNRIGLISDNYDYLSSDQINIERDRRLVDTIKNDLDDNEYQWNNLEMEETQLKVESTEMILDQLYNEVIEILEHIQFSRLRPDLYQFKSIYACEEIPKLSFQQTTTEDAGLMEGEDNVMI